MNINRIKNREVFEPFFCRIGFSTIKYTIAARLMAAMIKPEAIDALGVLRVMIFQKLSKGQ
jgi:hypothetical protein